jgi:DNA-binding NarL/FixJ family response regulator
MPISSPCRVAVQHEDPVVAAGLRALLGGLPDLQLLPPAAPAGSAAVVVADYRSALALHTLAQLEAHAGRPAARVMVFTSAGREREVRCALDAGLHGYLLQGCTGEEIAAGVRALVRGERYLCAAALQCLADSLAHRPLTGREADVLQGLAQGLGNKAIGRALGIAEGTVKAHVKAVLDKLQARTRTQAVVVAAQRGLVGAGEEPAAPIASAVSAARRTGAAARAPRLRAAQDAA